MFIYPYYTFVLFGAAFAAFFLRLFVKSKQPLQFVCSMLWLLPIGYETWVVSNCTGECNIRVDLLVIFPFELLLLIGISRFSWRAYKQYVGT
jgi:hypothetical protein